MHQLCKRHSWEDILNLNLSGYTIILDIDGVVMAHAETTVPDETKRYVENLKRNNDVFLVSNSLSTKRKAYTSEALDIPWIDSGHRKPSKRILSFMKYDVQKPLAVIGDKILTDGLFAYRIKATPLLLERRTSTKDPIATRLMYWIDDIFYSLCSLLFSR